MSEAPAATVVIPTRDRPESLARCLASLARQRDAGAFEAIVVDDGSRDRDAVAQAVAECSFARLLRLDGGGPGAARNAGARAARHPVICMLDDDCEASPRWLTTLVRALAESRVVAGSNANPSSSSPFVTATHVISHHVVQWGRDADDVLAFAPTMNVACRRELLLAIPFEERSLRSGAGEDRDWCARLRRSDVRVRAVPEAVVVHRQRLDARSFWRKHLRNGRAAHALRRADAGGAPRRRPRFFVELLLAGARRGPRVLALVLAAQLATAVGFAAEAVSERARRSPASGHRRSPTAGPRR